MAAPRPPQTPKLGESESARPSRLVMFEALRHRNFRFFWCGQLAAVSSQTMEFVAIAWLVLDLTGSPFILGLTSLAQAAPTLLFALFAGVLADRMDRRKLLVAIFAIASAIYFGLGVLVLTNMVQVWQVILAALCLGSLRVMDQPARHGMIPSTVPREDLAKAVTTASLAFQLPRPVAPALAGVLIALVGIGMTMCIVAMGALAAMVSYYQLDIDPLAHRGLEQGWVADILEGVRFIRADQVIYGLIGMTFVNSLFGMSYVVLLPVLARDVLHVGSEAYGLMQTAAGVGGLAGALAAGQLINSGHTGRQALGGAVLFGALLIALAYCPWYLPSCALLFLVGLANQVYMTLTTTVLQLSIPNELRGRVMSIWGLTFSLIPAGGAISGSIAEHFGAPMAVALGGLLVIVTSVAVALALPQIRRLGSGFRLPATA